MEPTFIPIEEAASILGLSNFAVYLLLESGAIDSQRRPRLTSVREYAAAHPATTEDVTA